MRFIREALDRKKKGMDIPYVKGDVARQAHVGIPEGTVEDEYARNGFFGRYAHLYRRTSPVGWTRIEGPLRPRAYDVASVTGPLLANADVRLSMDHVVAPMDHFLRDADADRLHFVHAGSGRLETDFGVLGYSAGDYLLIPRGTTFRFDPAASTSLLVLEAFSEIGLPEKGMLGQHALFDPAVLRVPEPGTPTTLAADARGEREVRILRRGAITKVWYPASPIDTAGWKGTLAPLALAVKDIRPVLSDRYHLPPSAHTTFVMKNAVVCTFLPRPLENGDERALKVPFFHSNIDFDEVLFYHAGEFFSRKGIRPGMLTLHPQGIHHGPQPGASERATRARRTEEVAVMLDTKNPLDVCGPAADVELPDYWKSWQTT